MIVSLNWLREYLDFDMGAEQVAAALTDIGLEVDRLEKREAVAGGLAGVVVGHVLACEKHPDADRLSVTTVDVGAVEPLQIVCGAPNVAAGQKVLVATVGTSLGENFKIKKSKIRGVESQGMICAEDELGIGTSHEGIMVLPANVAPGTPASEVLGLESDWIIEIGLTPNRVDGASHWGVARDLAAWLSVHGGTGREETIKCRPAKLHLPGVDGFVPNGDRAVKVDVQDPNGAPRYGGVTIDGLRVAPSPEWLQKRLRSIGLTPHNNVVDVTNFVLHEVGQPLHAFDADKIKGSAVVVRTCPEGTKFTTLDGVERTLSADDVMICDAEKPMCIAGVYGGLDSGVTAATTTIFLESAYFSPRRIRRTARRHGLSTDASFRYERGADPNICSWALRRAALLIMELAGGKVSEPVDIYPERIEDFYIELSFERLARLAGKRLPVDTIRCILQALDIRIASESAEGMTVFVPPFRVDVQREADLAEEILRIYGYNNIDLPRGLRSAVAPAPRPDARRMTGLVSEMLTAQGFNEAMSNSLSNAAYYEGCELWPVSQCVRILNPLSSDLGVMRQTLLFGALEAVRLNINHRRSDLKFYEFGNTYVYKDSADGSAEHSVRQCNDSAEHSAEQRHSEPGEESLTTTSAALLAPYSERAVLAITVTGNATAASWNTVARPADLFFLRGAVERTLRRFGININTLRFEPLTSGVFADGLAMQIGGREAIRMGIVAPTILAKFDIKQPVAFAEIDFEALLKAGMRTSLKVEELSRFPEVRRDLALLVDGGVQFAALREAAFKVEKKLLKEVTLFDVYEGDKLPAGKKSYALGFTIEDKSKTLTDKEIDRIMQAIALRLEKDCGAVVRS